MLAGAGTGKTRAITHRIAYGVHSGAYQGQRVLAVTFTARAAGEMRTRLRTLGVGGVQARTFHAAALRQLHYFWPQAIGGAAPEVMSQKAAAVAQAAASLRLDLARDRTAIRDLAAEVEWAKVSMLTPETYAAGARAARREPPGLDATAMARVLEAYEQVKTQRGVIDFEDVLLLTVGILAERDDIARAVRSQYRHFVVDEYQDVNALQQRLLDLWVGQRDDLCVVGDPAQTIYSFTGAEPDAPARVPDPAPQGPGGPAGAQLPLDPADRRAGQPRRARAVGLDAQQRACSCRPRAPDGPVAGADRPPGRPGRGGGGGRRDRHAGGRRGRPPAEIAVLFRTNGQSEAFESALADQDVPYLVRGGERFFSRREVRDAILLLRGAARSDDASKPLPELVRDVLLGAGWTREAPGSGGAGPRALGVAQRARRPVRRPRRRPRPRRGCPTSSASSTSGPPPSTPRPCRASRWPPCTRPRAWSGTSCSSPAARDGYLPIMMAETPEAIEEERRLIYVGVTRARRELRLSWSGARTPGRPGQPAAVAGSSTAPRASSARAPGPHPRAPARSGRARRRGGKPLKPAAPRALPHLRHRADDGRPAQDRSLRHLPADLLRGDVRAAARLAAGRRARDQRAGIRRLHRRDAHRDRRARAHLRGRAGPDLGRRGPQARALRRAGPGPHRRRRRRVSRSKVVLLQRNPTARQTFTDP